MTAAAPRLDLKTVRTILGYQRRPRYRKRKKKSAEWEVAVERPAYDLTIFKLHCGKLTLKIYTKGERVLRIEAIAHNTQELDCGRSLEKFPSIVSELKSILERFMDALSCIDQCFIADETLEQLPAPSQVGKTQGRWNRLQQGTNALGGGSRSGSFPFTRRIHSFPVGTSSSQPQSTRRPEYGPRRAAYDLKKLRGKQIVRRIAKSQRYEPIPDGLKTMTALIVLRNKAIKPLLAAAQRLRRPRRAQNQTPLDTHYETIRVAMEGVFQELGVAA